MPSKTKDDHRPPLLPSEVFATQVKAMRDRRQWTQQDLADRLVSMDATIDRSTVAKIESGSRGVSLDEAVTFAVALGVPPSALVLPRGAGANVRLAPNVVARAWEALSWWRGVLPVGPDKGAPRWFHDAQTDSEVVAESEVPGLRRLSNDVAFAVLCAGAVGGDVEVTGTADGSFVALIGPEEDPVRTLLSVLRQIRRRAGSILGDLEERFPELRKG